MTDSPPVRLSPVCLAVPFCQPFVITRHSSWLFTFAKYSCRDHCSTAVCSDCMCYVRRCGNPMAEMYCCCGSTGGGRARLKAVSGLRWLSVCSRCQLDTNRTEKIGRRLKTRCLYVQLYFQACSRNCEERLLAAPHLSVPPSSWNSLKYSV